MAFRKPSPDPPADAGDGETTPDPPAPDNVPSDEAPSDESEALALAEEAEARAAEAEAVAAAARARARAAQLRRQAAASEASEGPRDAEPAANATVEMPATEDGEATEATEAPEATDGTESAGGADAPARRRGLRLPRLHWKVAAGAAAIVAICVLLAASGYMTWHHSQAEAETQRTAEFAAAARQGVVTLMSLDHSRAQEDVQRIIDSSTGQFREDFEVAAEEFAAVAEQSQVVTDVTVNATAVESMTEDTAVVLVSATSSITNAAGADQDPRSWRLSVDMARDGDQLKMAKVEFAP